MCDNFCSYNRWEKNLPHSFYGLNLSLNIVDHFIIKGRTKIIRAIHDLAR